MSEIDFWLITEKSVWLFLFGDGTPSDNIKKFGHSQGFHKLAVPEKNYLEEYTKNQCIWLKKTLHNYNLY